MDKVIACASCYGRGFTLNGALCNCGSAAYRILNAGYDFTKEQLARLETLERENAQMRGVIAEQNAIMILDREMQSNLRKEIDAQKKLISSSSDMRLKLLNAALDEIAEQKEHISFLNAESNSLTDKTLEQSALIEKLAEALKEVADDGGNRKQYESIVALSAYQQWKEKQ